MDIVSPNRTGSIPSLSINGVGIPGLTCIRDLGAWFDQHMDMNSHIKKQCRGAYANLYKIGRIRKHLDTTSTKKLVHALVMSKLDINNGLLYGLPKKTIAPLQRVQNSAARLITRTRKFEHITPVLKQLHWLPIELRSQYKLITLVHKSLNGCAPEYIDSLLHPYNSARTTRTSTSNRLAVPRTRTKFGDRSFAVAAPKLWNTLPSALKDIRDKSSFGRGLKTLLFQKY